MSGITMKPWPADQGKQTRQAQIPCFEIAAATESTIADQVQAALDAEAEPLVFDFGDGKTKPVTAEDLSSFNVLGVDCPVTINGKEMAEYHDLEEGGVTTDLPLVTGDGVANLSACFVCSLSKSEISELVTK